MSPQNLKNGILVALAAIGAFITSALGGWDTAMKALIIVMTADIITGVLVAIVWKRSGKTKTGAADSRAMFKGLCRKAVILVIVWLAVTLDATLNTPGVIRTAVIFYFIGNEGLSIVENVGIMGIPLPTAVTNAFEQLRKRAQPVAGGGETNGQRV